MFRISGAFPAYEGAVLRIALERFEERLRASTVIDLDPPDDHDGARRADALVWICEAVLAGSAATDTPGALPARIVVHADDDVLTGANPGGRGHLEDGPALSSSMLRKLGCDAILTGPSWAPPPAVTGSGRGTRQVREDVTPRPDTAG